MPHIHHFLRCCTKKWQDRQMSMLCVSGGGLGVGGFCLLLRCDKTVSRQLKGYVANQPGTWLRGATAANQQRWWGPMLSVKCVRVSFDIRCLCCLSLWCRPASVFLDWLETIVWHVPTKCFASGGSHMFFRPLFFFFLFLLWLWKKVGSKVLQSLVFFFFILF